MSHIQDIVATNIANYRKQHDLSLENLAKRTDVSKNMLSQIERGVSNPTITTLWKIANGLHIPFSQLTAPPQNYIHFIDDSDIVPVIDNGTAIYPYFPYDEVKKFEMFKMSLTPGSTMYSEPHHNNSEEYIIVNQGTLSIEVNSQPYTINHNQAFRFTSDVPHRYTNHTDITLEFTATIYYP